MAFERILVAGAGGIGSVVGGMLHAAGHRVTLLGRRSHLRAIEGDGLRISGIFGDRTVTGLEVCDQPGKLEGSFSLVLCTVKSYDTESMAPIVARHLSDDGVVVSMQNGLGNIEALAARAGARRVLGARVIFGVEVQRPGAAHVTVIAEPVAIGPWPECHKEASARLEGIAREIAAMVGEAGIPAEARANIMPVIWTKVLYNAALNPLGALLRLHYGALADDADLRPVMDAVIDEAFAVAAASHVNLPFRDADAYRELFYRKLIPSTYNHRPSMLYDLEHRGRTEIGSLNGRIVELAERAGIEVTTNRILTRLIRARERILPRPTRRDV